ncbi:hypothetical protein HQ40_05055 [Porphyromonas gulae]|uniref:hypothetical protein n=1 Tax=Porphyromonas gulae TaxID=111105 RepID=UPI00052C49B6|nr:hypothetical protein [Porphyromonas gulae]KGN76153.1 hypothetical protein HQ40_05055 [Porphyromonas gulae]
MISFVILFVIEFLFSILLFQRIKTIKLKLLMAGCSVIHILATILYIQLAHLTNADALSYYDQALRATSWLETWGEGTNFIIYFLYPWVNWIGFDFILSFLPFSCIGLYGHYLIIRVLESKYEIKWSPFYLIILLPQLHFWTCAIGKDAIIFASISYLIFYWKISPKRLLPFAIALSTIGIIRAHILFILSIGFMIYLFFKLKTKKSVALTIMLTIGIFLLIPTVTQRVGLREGENLEEYFERAQTHNQDGGSSVNMSNANIAEKVFSYIARPMFFDANNAFLLEASFENVIWAYMFLFYLLHPFRAARTDYFFIFILLLLVNSYILTNLGISMRQKTMLFPFLFLGFLDLKNKISKNGKNIIYSTNR